MLSARVIAEALNALQTIRLGRYMHDSSSTLHDYPDRIADALMVSEYLTLLVAFALLP